MTDVNETPESRAALIEYEIVATRNRMGDELGEIGDRLRPERLKQRAKAAVSRKGSNMLRTIKENPLPSAIVALGLTLLFRARAKQHDSGNGHSSTLRETAKETAREKVHQVHHAVEQAGETAKRTTNKVQDFFESNPVIASAGVVVLGAAVGALIPETEKENRMMGRARDEIVEKTKGVVQHAQDKIEQKMSEPRGSARP